jgi:methionyl-tRNA formyltransferase
MQFNMAAHLTHVLRKHEIEYKFEYDLSKPADVAIILHYPALLQDEQLKTHKNNLVIHAGDLPKGRGRSPIHWQVEAGMNSIPMTLFEASGGADTGPWYLKDTLELDGTELLDEIRRKCLWKEMQMLDKWFTERPEAKIQIGEPTYFNKRHRDKQELDPNMTIAEQFNRMRVSDNYNYPLWFKHLGHEYKIEIFEMGRESLIFESDKNKDWIA